MAKPMSMSTTGTRMAVAITVTPRSSYRLSIPFICASINLIIGLVAHCCGRVQRDSWQKREFDLFPDSDFCVCDGDVVRLLYGALGYVDILRFGHSSAIHHTLGQCFALRIG